MGNADKLYSVVIKNNITTADLVFILFLTLKLIDRISWSWWWVTAPLWGAIMLRTLVGFIEDKDK